ncbi:MAG: nitrilase [Actinobacteria bacterium]|nr:nitrilase [Actinomycetota bacterium]
MTFVGARHKPFTEERTHYRALALQARTDAVNKCSNEEARTAMLSSISRISANIGAANAFLGGDIKLVVLPEYFLTGYPMGDAVPAWKEKAALDPDGIEYEKLGEVAQNHATFLSGNVYESDANFPELYFQTSFIIDPSGDVVLRYRRLHSMFSPSPWDVWDKYVDLYGIDAVFPVVKSEIGNLAVIASEEIQYPELARAFALRGAEVLLHSTSEVGSPALTPKDVAKRARAWESGCYLVSANSGGLYGSPVPPNSTDGMSKVLDYTGLVLAEAGFGESMVANAPIDLTAVRRHKAKPAMGNLLARTKTAMWAEEYGRHTVDTPNGLADAKAERSYFLSHHREAIENLARNWESK